MHSFNAQTELHDRYQVAAVVERDGHGGIEKRFFEGGRVRKNVIPVRKRVKM